MATQRDPFPIANLVAENEGVSITELVRRHLTDETHTTTDEELKNLRLTLYSIEETEERLAI